MYKILVIEDDEKLQAIMKETLSRYGYHVSGITDFKNVEDEFYKANPDLILLDINLPYYDGFYFCRIFRRKSKVPIIIVSARSEDAHQVMGMEMGADDYITKPFSAQVLTAKINAAIRRCYGEYAITEKKELVVFGLSLDEGSFKISYEGLSRELSKNEFRLLQKLLSQADKVVPREQLLEALWDDSAFVDDNTLTVNVTRVKAKLSEIGIDDVIKTKRGSGYLFDTGAMKG